ncbi:MAG: organomercurial lyase [Halobacteria archaeon]|nr:organomercurial lyase [Halobacteria archaeon]
MGNQPQGVENRDMQQDVAEKFRIVFGMDETPETLGEWADNTVQILKDRGTSVGFEEMCTTGSSRHGVYANGEVQHFRCVLDTLLYPFVLDEEDIEVRSRSPVSDEVIEVSVSQGDVSVEPEGAVMSFGIAAGARSAEEHEDPLEYGYRMYCPYINAFVDEEEYEEWASNTPDGVTMSVPLREGFELARILGENLAE